ncbi:MAG: ComF family protein [Desulfovibrio sp.]|nr:ComF family protein [Desulfovibrio sp.]
MTGYALAALHVLGLDQRRCAHCLRPFTPKRDEQGNVSLCQPCAAMLKAYAGSRCRRCGFPLPRSIQPAICPSCLHDPPPWHGLAFHGLYTGPLRHMLLRLKLGGQLYIARSLAHFLCEAVACLPRPDAVLAIPQHPNHLYKRGYNQAHELARALCTLTGLTLRTDLLTRIRQSTAQAQLSAQDRRANVRNSFRAEPQTHGLRLWLLDDVLTTGSTLREATQALLTAGAKMVAIVFVARTPLRS